MYQIRDVSMTLHLWAISCAASIAAYGDDSSLSALTFMPPAEVGQTTREFSTSPCHMNGNTFNN